MQNIKKQGQFRFVIYKRPGEKKYTGVCLDLDIIEEGNDSVALRKSLEEAAQGYLEAVHKDKLNDKLLNKPAPKIYWKILKDLEKYFHLLHQPSLEQTLPLQDSQVFTKNANDLARV